MKRFLLACCLLCSALSAHADPRLTQQVNAFIDEWHDDAAHARLRYFDKIASDGVYIGTDQTERWERDAFKAWAAPIFKRKVAWAFTAQSRHVQASNDQSIIWFDELLDTQMGVCQASGVLRRRGDSFEIVHYQLSMAVPNGVAKQVTGLIHAYEHAPAAPPPR